MVDDCSSDDAAEEGHDIRHCNASVGNRIEGPEDSHSGADDHDHSNAVDQADCSCVWNREVRLIFDRSLLRRID